jgi:NET1-associated nuclear protein 1 (U3 small nucleolar RNA-associated protein 17)
LHRPGAAPPPQCCAIDASDTILAAGDVSGRIVIWHGFQKALPAGGASSNSAGGGAAPACTTVHWHAQAVGCLAFSPDGAHLLSGGMEGALVR